MKTNKSILIIMDGWGLAEDKSVSAIDKGQTPFYDNCITGFPNIKLEASGLAVGLPKGQMGNSEVGHMNIGAGRIVYQMLVRINKSLEDNSFGDIPAFQELVAYCRDNAKPLHIMGLLSDGGVHSSLEHLKGIIALLAEAGLKEVYLHCFTDGRDTDPEGGLSYIGETEKWMEEKGVGKIATVIGRYFAMDRDRRWERTRKAYDLLVNGKGTSFPSAAEALKASYANNVTDEFVEPVVITQEGSPVATLQEGDGVLFFNFRTDRGRQLTEVLTQADLPDHGMKTIPLHYVTATRYDEDFKGIPVLFEKEPIQNGMGDYLSSLGKNQVRIAETEKYPHVTFFFNGGREEPTKFEQYELCPSPKVATYDLKPEMSAYDIRDRIIPILEKGEADFICLNFANPDMVGHTGSLEAAVKACEVVDECTQAVAETAAANGYRILITADHGNADRMRNPDGSPHTAHTTVLVPLILIDPENSFTFPDPNAVGKLGDLAPTLLTLMGIHVPEEMTGNVLVQPVETQQPV